jgi:hypothetical protein
MSHFQCEPEPEPERTAVAAPPAAPSETPLAARLQRQLELQQSPPILPPRLLREPQLRYDMRVPNGYRQLDSVEMLELGDRFRKMTAFTNLNGRCQLFSYVHRFGMLSEEHPFGNSLWSGMHEAALAWERSYPTRPMGNLLRDWEPAWFCPPEEWSKVACKKPLSIREARDKPGVYADGMYPTWVRKQTSGVVETIVEIKCLHIVLVLMRHSWCVHQSRIIYEC